MSTILDEILANKKKDVERSRAVTPLETVCHQASQAPPPRSFCGALSSPSNADIHLIAEIKHKSPSAGVIIEPFEPRSIAKTYQSCGASAISVLTDHTYFGGRLEDVTIVRQEVELPVLRKEFIVDEYQIYEARAAHADAILLIVEAIGIDEVRRLLPVAQSLGMGALIECHHTENLKAAIDALGPAGDHFIFGINNRDLTRQVTDLSTTAKLSTLLPAGSPFVTESGIRTADDVARLKEIGASAMLVGEAILSATSPESKIRELLGQ